MDSSCQQTTCLLILVLSPFIGSAIASCNLFEALQELKNGVYHLVEPGESLYLEVGEHVSAVCDSGFFITGGDQLTCTENGTFIPSQVYCNAQKTPGPTARRHLTRGDSTGLDLVFAFDKSFSMGRTNFQKVLNFTKALIDEFGIDYENFGGTRVAAVSFASVAKIEFNYGEDTDTKDKVFAKLDAIEITLEGGTAIEEALKKIVIDIIPELRNNSKRALFIITDGHANTPNPIGFAKDLRDIRDFEIFAIGIGDDIDREQIRTVASPPYTNHVFLIYTFEDLAEIAEVIKPPDYTKCGISGDWELPEGTYRRSNLHAWPWIAHIYRGIDDFGETYGFYCEGSLISEQWVVVAASCLNGNPRFDEPEVVPMGKLRVEFGMHSYIRKVGCEQNASVIEIHRPSSYNNVSLSSDIALLKLDHPLVFDNCVHAICLPTDEDRMNFFPGKLNIDDTCYQAGWGSSRLWKQQEEDTFPRWPKFKPNQVAMPLVSDARCRRHHSDIDLSGDILCAGTWKKAKNECTGQVGTPLVCRRDDNKWVIMGVLFDGSRCDTIYPYYGFSFFTKVYNYVRWIKSVTENRHDAHAQPDCNNKFKLSELNCGEGLGPFVRRGKVVGGHDAKPGAWPWMVGLYEFYSELEAHQPSFFCGGSLISHDMVLTAAHCFGPERANIENIIVAVGSIKRITDRKRLQSPEDYLQILQVAEIIKHEQYNHATYDYDIALLRLQTDVNITSRVKPVCIPESRWERNNDLLQEGVSGPTFPYVTGWGLTNPFKRWSLAENLKELAIPLRSRATCAGTLENADEFTERMICAGYIKGEQTDRGGLATYTGQNDSCYLDSGGPVVRARDIGGIDIYYQIGIVSWGRGCARKDTFGFYTNLPILIDWIKNKTAGMP